MALEVRGLSAPKGVSEVSFHVGSGEIVGLIGLVGSGRTETARAVIGADPATSGEVLLHGEPYRNRSPSESARRGLVMTPEDRRKQGLVMTLPVRANLTLPHLAAFAGFGGTIRTLRERRSSRRAIDHYAVRPANTEGDILNYSGGNQQKVLLAKWLLRDPDVVILDEPSRGVDVGARRRIHEAVAEIAERGAAVLLISSEIEEVLGLAHRAYLISGGRIHDEIDPAGMSEGEVLRALFRLQENGAHHAAPKGVIR